MNNNSLSNIREAFLDYFIKNNHTYVPSSSLIPHNDNSLLFTNAGMVQFKNVFLGLEQRYYNKATSVQKCLRAGGKHNDLDNVGYTSRHQTFFEMLGNFSFGDYFKEQAIYYAYKFITQVLNINKNKLLVTVYSEDTESYALWQKIANFSSDKIIKINTNDNFWSMGETGPSGPCTEIFYDLGEDIKGGPPGTSNAEGDRFTEIWNLVFMQYNQLGNGKYELLKTPAVDTGMGLERIAAVMQGVVDNYDTDLFQNIINAIQDLLKITITPSNKVSFKVIADHIRASAFLISDGILPSNEGRGYVLRRIIRRAIRHGYLLGNKTPILYKLIPVITELMKVPYNELVCSLYLTKNVVYNEEEKFNKTIEGGMKLLLKSKDLVQNNLLPGDIAFKLYDTYGFPLDLTESILQQENIKVDIDQFNLHMKAQKEQSKKHWIGSGEVKDNDFWFRLNESITTEFIGYEKLNYITTPLAIVGKDLCFKDNLLCGEEAFLVFKETPFYPESGGQIGDQGIIASYNNNINSLLLEKDNFRNLWGFYYTLQDKQKDFATNNLKDFHFKEYEINNTTFTNIEDQLNCLIEVSDTVKVANSLIIHKVKVIYGNLSPNNRCMLIVNSAIRERCAANHTATHILYAVLNKVLKQEVTQQGSLVSYNRFKADVSLNKPLTKEQITVIESEATRIILSNLPVNIKYMSYKDAINNGVSFLMGENYPDTVRVVSIGTDDQIVSKEMCGGCHVKHTGEIGIFKIMIERAIRSGVRRLEVVTGQSALQAFQKLELDVNNVCSAIKANKNNMMEKINTLLIQNNDLSKKIENLNLQTILTSIEQNLQKTNTYNYIKLLVNSHIFSQVKNIANTILIKYKPAVLFILYENNELTSFVLTISVELSTVINLTTLMQELLSQNIGVKGGGSNLCIQGSVYTKYTQILENIIVKRINK